MTTEILFPFFLLIIGLLALIALFTTALSLANVPSNSTLYYDRLINVTPRVIDQSIEAAVTKVQTQNGVLNPASRKRNLEQLEMHCIRSLKALGLAEHAEACEPELSKKSR